VCHRSELHGLSSLERSLSATVANGTSVRCSQFQQIELEIQGYLFRGELKLLSCQHYDVILGYDRLEAFSPMKIHWEAKWMSPHYGGATAVIQGILSELQASDVTLLCQLTTDLQGDSSTVMELPKASS
jgi:hypothetical protein